MYSVIGRCFSSQIPSASETFSPLAEFTAEPVPLFVVLEAALFPQAPSAAILIVAVASNAKNLFVTFFITNLLFLLFISNPYGLTFQKLIHSD